MRWLFGNLLAQKHWKVQVAMRVVGLSLLAWGLFLGGSAWATVVFAALVLASTALTFHDRSHQAT